MLEEFIEANNINGLLQVFKKDVYSAVDASKLTKSPLEDIIKSILFIDPDGNGLLAIVRGDKKVSLEKLKKESGLKEFHLASSFEALDISGFPLGGMPPFGIYGIKTILDAKVLERETIWCGGGELNKLLQLSIKELKRVLEETAEDFKIADISE